MPKFSDLAPYILEGGVSQVQSQMQAKQEQQQKLRQILAAAMAQEQAKTMFDPVQQAKQRAIQMGRSEAANVQPPGGFSRSELENPALDAAIAPVRNAREMEFLKYVLPSRSDSGDVSPITFDQNTGTYLDTQGNPVESVPRGTPVRNRRASPELLQQESAARAAGSAEGDPKKRAVTQNFKDIQSGLAKVDQMLSADKGFKGQLLATGIPFQPGAGNLQDELTNISDVLLRARSGAQINEKEYDRLRGLLPRSRDAISELMGNPDRARQKLVKFKEAMDEVLSTGTPSVSANEGLSFDSEEEAEAADLPPGTEVLINGRRAVSQ